jgi:HEAT repeat protein
VVVACSSRRGLVGLCRATALILLLATVVGCHPWPMDFGLAPEKTVEKPPKQSEEHHASSSEPRPPTGDKFAPLADPYWVAAPADTVDPIANAVAAAKRRASAERNAASAVSGRSSTAPPQAESIAPHRWRHPGIEKFLAARPEGPKRLDEFREAAASSNPVVATNAAILLGREGHREAVGDLVRAIESSKTNIWQRRAAIEALADTNDDSIITTLQTLVDEQSRFAAARSNSYVPETHADLLDALARVESREGNRSSQAAEPRFAAALANSAAIVRRAALLGLLCPAAGPLPADVVHYATDDDRQVRQGAMIAIAARTHPEALDVMRRGLADRDLDVRLAAVAGLGLIERSSSEARTELKNLTANTAELIRVAAFSALLDSSGDSEELAAAAADKSWRVRLVAATALARDARQRSAALAERLVADANVDVATQTIKSLEAWPLERAGPVLFKALEGLSYAPRKLAAEQLGRRWPPAKAFEIDAPADRREKLVADLERDWRSQFGVALSSEPTRNAVIEPKREQIEIAAVERLNNDDVPARRQAAEELRERFASRPLSASALARLAELMARESDALVWLAVFDLLAVDAREPATRMAYGALSHPSPEVRRRACEQLAAHPANAHGPLLLVSLDDPNSVVVEAAVKALGRLDSLPDTGPLERLLANPDHQLRVEAAKTLVHVGANSGVAALERLAFDTDPKVRHWAAMAMGETPDPSFLPDLIHLLDDRPEICRAALASLSRVAGRETPATNASTAATARASEAERWKEWFHSQTTIR